MSFATNRYQVHCVSSEGGPYTEQQCIRKKQNKGALRDCFMAPDVLQRDSVSSVTRAVIKPIVRMQLFGYI